MFCFFIIEIMITNLNIIVHLSISSNTVLPQASHLTLKSDWNRKVCVSLSAEKKKIVTSDSCEADITFVLTASSSLLIDPLVPLN